MFRFPSFSARLPDEISTTDVLKDRANISLSASQPSSRGGGFSVIQAKYQKENPRMHLNERSLHPSLLAPVLPVDAVPG